MRFGPERAHSVEGQGALSREALASPSESTEPYDMNLAPRGTCSRAAEPPAGHRAFESPHREASSREGIHAVDLGRRRHTPAASHRSLLAGDPYPQGKAEATAVKLPPSQASDQLFSQFRAFFRLGCTRGGSPGIFG